MSTGVGVPRPAPGSVAYRAEASGSAAIRNAWGPTATLECSRDGDMVVLRWRTSGAIGDRGIVVGLDWTDAAVTKTCHEVVLGDRVLTRCDYDPPLPLLTLPAVAGTVLRATFSCAGEPDRGTFSSTVEAVEADDADRTVMRYVTVAESPHTRDEEAYWLDIQSGLPVRAVWQQEAKGFFGFSAKGQVTLTRVDP